MRIKQILITSGVVLIFLLVTFLSISFLQKRRDLRSSDQSSVSDSDMASHHAPPPAADDSILRSLVGQKAPEFNLESFDGRKVNLNDFRDKKVVLFFSEGAMCYPSCWNQMVSLGKDPNFNNDTVAVVSIIVDPRDEWESSVKKMPELKNALVLLDSDRSVAKAYGVLTLASSMHRGQFPGHTYIILDKEGVIKSFLDDPDMQERNQEVLKELEEV